MHPHALTRAREGDESIAPAVKMVPVRLHCPMFAFVRSAPVKLASVRSAPKSVTPVRLEPEKLARFRLPFV